MSAGIEVRGHSIRIWYKINGKRFKETLSIPATPSNIDYAQHLAQIIALEIKMDTFDISRHFPNSKRIAGNIFEHYIQGWSTRIKHSVAPSSWRSYNSHCNNHILPVFGKLSPKDITANTIDNWINSKLQPKLANKTIREVVSIFRKIWRYWQRTTQKDYIQDPSAGIVIRMPDPDDIDPFTQDEIKTILAHSSDPAMDNLWPALLWSGLSMHEFICLGVDDIDTERGMIHVQRSCVRGAYRVTKNRRRNRSIRLLSIAKQAIFRQIVQVTDEKTQSIEVLQRDNRSFPKLARYAGYGIARPPAHITTTIRLKTAGRII